MSLSLTPLAQRQTPCPGLIHRFRRSSCGRLNVRLFRNWCTRAQRAPRHRTDYEQLASCRPLPRRSYPNGCPPPSRRTTTAETSANGGPGLGTPFCGGGDVAQCRQVPDGNVAGSTDPLRCSRTHPTGPGQALVAQGIEHRSPKAGVAGSNPAGGTNLRLVSAGQALVSGCQLRPHRQTRRSQSPCVSVPGEWHTDLSVTTWQTPRT